MLKPILAALALAAALPAFAAGTMDPMVWTEDQSVANGVVSAGRVTAAENGWLVVHRTDEAMKPGPVIGHAPIRAGDNLDVAAILTEAVMPGDMLMLMVHSEAGGMSTGIFEYTLGATEDGPVRVEDKLVMKTITVE